jgi:hypothetical protein
MWLMSDISCCMGWHDVLYIVVLLVVDCNCSRVPVLFTTVRALPDLICSFKLLLQISESSMI